MDETFCEITVIVPLGVQLKLVPFTCIYYYIAIREFLLNEQTAIRYVWLRAPFSPYVLCDKGSGPFNVTLSQRMLSISKCAAIFLQNHF